MAAETWWITISNGLMADPVKGERPQRAAGKGASKVALKGPFASRADAIANGNKRLAAGTARWASQEGAMS